MNPIARSARKGFGLLGRFAVEPLYEVLADESLADLHGPASLAFTFCAYEPIFAEHAAKNAGRRSPGLGDWLVRNHSLEKLRIAHRNDFEEGFVVFDNKLDEKYASIEAFWSKYSNHYTFDDGDKWGAIFTETGFVQLMGDLFTGQLESEAVAKGQPVWGLIAERWQISFTLNILAVLIAWFLSIPLGIRSARQNGSLEDQTTTSGLFCYGRCRRISLVA